MEENSRKDEMIMILRAKIQKVKNLLRKALKFLEEEDGFSEEKRFHRKISHHHKKRA